MNKTEKLIIENAVRIAKIIECGDSIEIRPSRDGIKIYEVRKKTIKSNKEVCRNGCI